MRSIVALLSFALVSAAPPPDALDEVQIPGLSQFRVPCLQPREVERHVVSWWIEDKRTGERRAVGSQEVRLRC
jgi:hypothetical protein